MKTISGPRAPGPGPGPGRGRPGRRGTGAQPPAQRLPKPGGPAGWGPEVTQRTQRDKRHPLALAPISGAPRPLTSLQRPPRTPLSPPEQSFPWPGSDPGIGSVPVSRRPRPRLRDLSLSRPRPFPSLPLSPGRTGVLGPCGRAHPPSARSRGKSAGRGRPRSAPRLPGSLDRAFCSLALLLSQESRFGRKLWAQLSALSSLALGKRQTTPRAFPARRPPPAAGSRARPSAASVERARQRRGGAAGPAAARGGQLSPRVLGHPRWCEGETTSQCRFTTLFLPGAGESGVTNSLKKLFWTISAGVFSNTRRFPGLGSRS